MMEFDVVLKHETQKGNDLSFSMLKMSAGQRTK